MVMVKSSGLEGVIAAESELSLVDGQAGHLVYRGYWAKDLALNYSFEEVAYLLWYGQLPTKQELEWLKERLWKHREIPEHVQQVLDVLPRDTEMMSVLRTALSAMGQEKYSWKPTIDQAIELTALLPTLIAYRYRQLEGVQFIKPSSKLDHVANYLYMLSGEEPNPAHVRALSAYFVLTMEHGMNASTFTARVISSTESDMVSALSGAIGAMKGPLHGGAPSEVMDMLTEVGGKENAEAWIRSKLEQGERLMGFGHRVYKTRDPRAEALRFITSELSSSDPWFDLASHVEETAVRLLQEYKPGRQLYTNVEFYAAAVLRAVKMPETLYTPTFTASRIVGWSAHILEQAKNNRIFRPQSSYVGSMPE
jgi:citrate synthase